MFRIPLSDTSSIDRLEFTSDVDMASFSIRLHSNDLVQHVRSAASLLTAPIAVSFNTIVDANPSLLSRLDDLE